MSELDKVAEGEDVDELTECPVCGGPIIYQEGCNHCPLCGWGGCK